MSLSSIKKVCALMVTATTFSTMGMFAFAQVNATVEQTKSNDDKLHNMHLFCHEAFDPKVCIQAGKAYEAKGGTNSIKRAVTMFGIACNVDALGCSLQGAAIYNNSKTIERRSKALKPWTKGCEANNGRACNGLGVLFEEGVLGKIDLGKAFKLFDKACSLAWSVGCFNVGYAYEYGRGVEKSLTKAAEKYSIACESGTGRGCLYAGFSYLNGEGVEKSLKTSTTFFEKGCETGDLDSCHNFGNSLQTGTGVDEDSARAAGIWRAACEAKHSSSCYRLARSYALGQGVEKNIQKAATLGDLACQPGSSGWLDACHNLGHTYWDDKTLGFATNLSKARRIMEKACAANDKDACNHVEDLKANKAKPTLRNSKDQ